MHGGGLAGKEGDVAMGMMVARLGSRGWWRGQRQGGVAWTVELLLCSDTQQGLSRGLKSCFRCVWLLVGDGLGRPEWRPGGPL